MRGGTIPATPATSPTNIPCSRKSRPRSCGQNQESREAPTPIRTLPATPISSESGTQMKLSGGRRAASADRKRLSANPTSTPTRASQKICESAQRGSHAAIVVHTGASSTTAICQAAGGRAPARRGIAVKRNPTAKHLMKPWIRAMAWNTGW